MGLKGFVITVVIAILLWPYIKSKLSGARL